MKKNQAKLTQAKKIENQIIKDIQSGSFIGNLDWNVLRREWQWEFSRRICQSVSEHDLFVPKEYSYERLTSAGSGGEVIERIALGYWGISVIKNKRNVDGIQQKWTFNISVNCGGTMVFHPAQAKNSILKHHSVSVYEKWRQVVLKDLDSFARVLDAYNPPLHVYSPTCSVSSERVCRRLGLPVRGGIAYLLHKKNKDNKHRVGGFLVN